jgi:sulfite reductase (NADPH) flavoprotein alpha-component
MDKSKEEYTRLSPFIAKIKSRHDLCHSCDEKNTQHIVLDLSDSDMSYTVGDCVGVYPVNDPLLVQKTLTALKANEQDIIIDKRSKESMPLITFLKIKANVSDISRKLIQEIAKRQTSQTKKKQLDDLLAERDELKKYLEGRQLWDVLSEHKEVVFELQELCDLLMPLLPRYYSIASSQKQHHDEMHLTVKLLNYDAHGHARNGVCTHYLCNLAPKEEPIVPIFIQPHKGFTVPEDPDAPMIMVGPGTGVAPFRAFMQERITCGAQGNHWLFFGEWRREKNFLYGDYWLELEKNGKLKLDVAFSRDQEDKCYVQHLLIEKGREVYDWLMNGCYFYVCGDAKYMAKDVDGALVEIMRVHGNMSAEDAKAFVKNMRKEKRYLRDVY